MEIWHFMCLENAVIDQSIKVIRGSGWMCYNYKREQQRKKSFHVSKCTLHINSNSKLKATLTYFWLKFKYISDM